MSERSFPSRRVCLVLLSGIGDVVHGLPLVNALKRDDPQRRITWVVERSPAPLLEPHEAIDEVIRFDRKRGLTDVWALRRELRGRRFDAVLNCGIYFKSAIPTYFARAPVKLGYGSDRANDLVWLLANRRLPPHGPRHRQEMYLEFLEFLGVKSEPIEWRIAITEEERVAQAEFYRNLDARRVAAIVATSAMPPKDWPPERFAQLATALDRDFGFRVLLLGGPGEREQERARVVAARTEANAVWALGPNLRRLVYLLDGCDLLIAPDTGPLHIARALGTPVIGLYGHTDPRRAGPYGAFGDLTIDRYNYESDGRAYEGTLERPHPARAGGRGGRMELISVEAVLEKVEHAVRGYVDAGGMRC